MKLSFSLIGGIAVNIKDLLVQEDGPFLVISIDESPNQPDYSIIESLLHQRIPGFKTASDSVMCSARH